VEPDLSAFCAASCNRLGETNPLCYASSYE
jgi:hypothetical protein